jgi:pyochelin biosynthetic protein PchG
MINPVKRLRVIVCGTTFGRIYLRGIAQLADKFELVGIFARGSSNAKDCAHQYNVPLYNKVEQLPHDEIDVACVVIRSAIVGGQGTSLAKKLLMKGIHVIQEHPVHHDELVECLKSGQQSNCHYSLNSFYPDLEPVHLFIKSAKQALQQREAIYVDAACSIVVLYPLIDILGQMLGRFRPWSFSSLTGDLKSTPLTSLSGQIGGVPLTLRVQNQINSNDPDNSSYLLHRIELCTSGGSLILVDTHGPVLWNHYMHVPRRKDGVLDMFGSDSLLDLSTIELLESFRKNSFKTVFTQLWPESIKTALCRFREKIISGTNDAHSNQYQLTACRVWQEIGQKLGPAQIISPENRHPLVLEKNLHVKT